MESRYQSEITEFQKHFSAFEQKSIVLYGIGRMTATLLNAKLKYHFVGLMDKDPSRIGTELFGLPILTKKEAEESADILIINTSATHWETIFERISDIKIPVYYRNGTLAEKETYENEVHSFFRQSKASLHRGIKEANIICVDFFDTLIVRDLLDPMDVFRLIEIKIKQHGYVEDYLEYRNAALNEMPNYYTLDQLYEKMSVLAGWECAFANDVKRWELEIELKLLKPNSFLRSCLRRKLDAMQVYIVSDMYLPMDFYKAALRQCGIDIPEEHILISNEKKGEKKDGVLWRLIRTELGLEERLFCIGDDIERDVKNAEKAGLQAWHWPAPGWLLKLSTIGSIYEAICTPYASAIIGLVKNYLFLDPFRMKQGQVLIEEAYEMGYCVFGPVLLTFFQWLEEKRIQDDVKRLLFLSRDGFFLKEDFLFFLNLIGKETSTEYIGISRQLGMIATIRTEEDLVEYIKMPYSGKLSELLEDRFHIKGGEEYDALDMESFIDETRGSYLWKKMSSYVVSVQKNYKAYLNGFDICESDAVVDLGYYGNNQKYISLLSGKSIKGYYFVAEMSEENRNAKEMSMQACFQDDEDVSALRGSIYPKLLFIENFLTAPYGMVEEVRKDGSFICKKDGGNQKFFKVKREINEGVKGFLREYIEKFGEFELPIDIGFINRWYDVCFSRKMQYGKRIRESFYNDNRFMNRFDTPIFD